MGRCVIAVFRPKPGQERALLDVVGRHWRVLQAEQLVTDRPRTVMQAADGSVVEVFEWRSAEAIEAAHANPAVQALWEEFGAACDYLPIAALPEAQQLFSEFTPLAL